MVNRPLSGEQYVLRDGATEAVIAGVGATLRSLTHAGRDLVVPFAADELRPAYRGVTLAPWPNRVTNGRFTFGGVEHRLPLTEPRLGHALHGLVTWQRFEPLEHDARRVTLVTTVEPQDGYPWRLRIETTYAIDADGLTQTVRATNQSSSPAPFGTGPHPYLVAGPGTIDDWTLELPADHVLLTDDRLVPTALADVTVDAARFDFRSGRRLRAVELDHAFTGLPSDTVVRITTSDGTGVKMRWGAECPWVQVHTADGTGRTGLAVEPMTCAPDAFNEAAWDTGLIVLEPGSSAEAAWTIAPLG